MAVVGLVGGTGLERIFSGVEEGVYRRDGLEVRYARGSVDGVEVLFIPRHGWGHEYPPHRVPYEVYMHMFRSMGVDRVVGLSAVGSLRPDLEPGAIVLPTQLIDYSLHGRTLYELRVYHADFTRPYCPQLVGLVVDESARRGFDVRPYYTYVSTYGPRFETAAEISMLRRAGGDVVGMTSVPESVLAREAGIHYLLICIVSNYAAGMQERVTEEEVYRVMSRARTRIGEMLRWVLPLVGEADLTDSCSSPYDVYREVYGT